MLAFILRRLLIAIPTIVLVSVFVFMLQKLLPGDPVLVMAGEERDPEVSPILREKYRLNDPADRAVPSTGSATPCRAIWASRCAPASRCWTLIGEKLPVTIQLAVMAMIIAFADRHPGRHPVGGAKGTLIDYIANVVALSGLSIPNFWLGIMLILLCR
jgi:peptide/nickel transport system permease protein